MHGNRGHRIAITAALLSTVLFVALAARTAIGSPAPGASSTPTPAAIAPRPAPSATPAGPLPRVPATTGGAATHSPTAVTTRPSLRTTPPAPIPGDAESGPPPYIPTLAPAERAHRPPFGPTPAPDALQVHFINVGQGDAILILAPGGEVGLIDGGYGGMGTLEYLQAHGVTRVNLLVATHPHADHIGGLVNVLRALPVDEVVTNGAAYTTQVYEHFLDAVAAAKAEYHEVQRGDTLALGRLTFQVLSPAATDRNGDINDGSLVLRLVYGPTSFLFTGDAQAHAEQAMLAAGQPLRATILKVGHHGSATSSSTAFLQQVQPRVAVYSGGLGNPYGHPAAATLAHLAAVGAAIYGTDVNGISSPRSSCSL